MGFEPMINQRLLPPTFPRYTRIKPRPEALQYMDELVARLRHAWKITSCNGCHSALVCDMGSTVYSLQNQLATG